MSDCLYEPRPEPTNPFGPSTVYCKTHNTYGGCPMAHDERDARLQSLEAENKALREATQWQPIETAPRDGTQFIAWVDGYHRLVAWTKTSHVPLVGWCLLDQGIEDCDICQPTHWMPLPPPPKE